MSTGAVRGGERAPDSPETQDQVRERVSQIGECPTGKNVAREEAWGPETLPLLEKQTKEPSPSKQQGHRGLSRNFEKKSFRQKSHRFCRTLPAKAGGSSVSPQFQPPEEGAGRRARQSPELPGRTDGGRDARVAVSPRRNCHDGWTDPASRHSLGPGWHARGHPAWDRGHVGPPRRGSARVRGLEGRQTLPRTFRPCQPVALATSLVAPTLPRRGFQEGCPDADRSCRLV